MPSGDGSLASSLSWPPRCSTRPVVSVQEGAIRFENVTEASRLAFVLQQHATPDKHMVETMAGGVAVFDYDGDGRPDIFFTNGASLPSLQKETPADWNRLYRNEGGFRFTDVTEKAGVQGLGYTTGAAVGDYDNDGREDLFVAGVQRNQLLRNAGNGTFADVTGAAGIGNYTWSVAAGWLDYDNDGWLDLFVVNYVDWTPQTNKFCGDRAPQPPGLLPSEALPGPGQRAVPQPARRHLRGRLGQVAHRSVDRQGHERGVCRLRRRRLHRHLRHQRRGPQLSLPQPRRWHLRGRRRCSPAWPCRRTGGRCRAWAPTSATTTTTAGPTSSSRR